MITAVRIFHVEPGRVREATEYLKRVKAKFDEVAPNKTRQLMRTLTGDTGRLLLVISTDSLQEFDEAAKKVTGDRGVEALLNEGAEKRYFSSITLTIHEEVT